MKQWYAKEFADLVQVSVRTLHHYDKIGLLKPSLRQNNNYRLYSEADLLKLQQIIALKFFGFELAQIKELLAKQENVSENLAMQSRFLREKAESLLEASSLLDSALNDYSNNESISWEDVIKIIEVYEMTKQLEDSWVKEIFSPDELKEYAQFESEMKAKATPERKQAFEKKWYDMVAEFENNLHIAPDSETGIALGKKLIDWVNQLYGKKYAHLRTKKFEQGFGKGKGIKEHGLSPEVVAYMEKAMDAYWKQRVYTVLNQAGKISSSELRQSWDQLMDEMYGDEDERKKSIPALAYQDDNISAEAKEWLRAMFNL